jgi:hypothetical protein
MQLNGLHVQLLLQCLLQLLLNDNAVYGRARGHQDDKQAG